MMRATLDRSEKTSTNWSKTVWNAARPDSLNATSATTLTRAPPHSIGVSFTAIAMAVECAVIVIACGTARVSVNAVDDMRSRSIAAVR